MSRLCKRAPFGTLKTSEFEQLTGYLFAISGFPSFCLRILQVTLGSRMANVWLLPCWTKSFLAISPDKIRLDGSMLQLDLKILNRRIFSLSLLGAGFKQILVLQIHEEMIYNVTNDIPQLG